MKQIFVTKMNFSADNMRFKSLNIDTEEFIKYTRYVTNILYIFPDFLELFGSVVIIGFT